jgi:CspA family cold shock protein
MQNGSIKWFDPARGFGFITPDNQSGDVFVHFSSIVMEGYKQLQEGDRVAYDEVPSTKRDGKYEAKNVTLIQ